MLHSLLGVPGEEDVMPPGDHLAVRGDCLKLEVANSIHPESSRVRLSIKQCIINLIDIFHLLLFIQVHNIVKRHLKADLRP